MTTYGELRDSLDSFLSAHLEGLENAERVEALLWYCQGLGLEMPEKTALGLAARLAPENVQAVRQRMQRAIASGRFSHETVFERLQQTVFASGQMRAYCFDDTGIAKKGDRSVGVQRQYSGTLGKVGNCQVIVSLHGVSDSFGACLGTRLYMPESWCESEELRELAGVPESVTFKKKWELALDLLEAALENGAPRLPVLADAGYGDCREFRDRLRELGLNYAVGVSSQTTVWRPGTELEVPQHGGGAGRPCKIARAVDESEPVLVSTLATELHDEGRFQTVRWRKGTKGWLCGQFAAVRVCTAEKRKRKPPGKEEWLLIEREKDGAFKYTFASLPRSISLKMLVLLTKMRWHVERDYQNMKQKLGFDKYEGRSWGGLHRHLAMVALMHAFLSLHAEDFSPSGEDESLDVAGLPSSDGSGATSMVGPLHDLPTSV